MNTLTARQDALIEKFSFVPDTHERLGAVVRHRPQLPPLTPGQRTDAHLVSGCASRVWVAGFLENGQCRFATDSESVLVRGLVGLLCELYDGAAPAEVIAFEPGIFEALEIAKNLSPTRQHGLAQVRRVIREFAAVHDVD